MVNSKIKKIDEEKKITKVKKQTPKPEKVSWETIPLRFLKVANRGGRILQFHSAWFSQDDAKAKQNELKVNGTEAVIVVHHRLKERYFAIYEIMKKVG